MNNKTNGRAVSLPVGLGIGACISLGMTLLCTAVLAYLLEKETVTWETAGYGIMMTLILTSFTGAKISWLKIKRQKLMVSMLSGLLYFAILLSITALFFGGQYDAVGVTLSLVAAGCGSAAMLGIHGKRGGGNKKINRNIVKLYK